MWLLFIGGGVVVVVAIVAGYEDCVVGFLEGGDCTTSCFMRCVMIEFGCLTE